MKKGVDNKKETCLSLTIDKHKERKTNVCITSNKRIE